MAGSSQIAQRTKLCLTDMDDNGAVNYFERYGRSCNTTTMIMISNNVIGIYEGGGGRIAAGDGLFAGGLFAAGLIAGGLFASGLNAAPRINSLHYANLTKA